MATQNRRMSPEDDTKELTLRDMAAPLFRQRKVVLATFCCLFVLTILVAFGWAARYYVSTMQVVVEADRSDPAVTAAQDGTVPNNKSVTLDQVTSEMALLQGQDMMRATAKTCGLASGWSISDVFLPSDPARRMAMKEEAAARQLGKKIKVEAEKTSDVIDVSYGRAGDPAIPACVLQTLSKLYLEKHLQLVRPAGTTTFFAEETAKYQKALAGAEANLADFSKDEGVAAPDILRTDMAQQVATTEGDLDQARQAAAADQQRISDLKRQLDATPSRSTTSEASISANLLLENLNATLLATQLKRSQLLMKYDPSYPLVQEADQEIAEAKAAIAQAEKDKYLNVTTDRDPTYELLREDEAKTEADLASQKASAGALVASLRNLRSQMVDLDGEAVKQASLVRDVKVDEANYLLYLTKREEERTSDALDKKGIANVAIAVAPVVPVLPAHSPFLVLILGLMATLVLSFGAGFVAEHLDPSFRTPDEVAEALSVPVLACVPKKAA
ncbi:MAG TPA: hypothetical protein VMJ93_17635 [Verrucomicrobiae bacterium]|nr:hypothetical protein [Verrucomicrobiae bacterium]